MITKEEIREILEKHIKNEERNLLYHNLIKEILTPMDGKAVSKRIATAIQKKLPNASIYWDTQHGMYRIWVWGGETELKYDDRMFFLIAYPKHPYVDAEKFEKFDGYHGRGAEERLRKLKSLLDGNWTEQVCQKIQEYIQAKNNLDAILEDGFVNPAYYDISRNAGLIK